MTRVSLENVSVEFPIYGTQHLSLRGAIAQRAIGGRVEQDARHKNGVIVRALTDINLKLEDGDRLGLVGHNGSGKSTLLKVIAGIYEPVYGKITVNGRITPLFDMMPGLDVDDTGYENILTAGLLLGMTREEITQQIPEIEEVSELGEYLQFPVRTYSAGMMTRLGFALVTALNPDVLVLDEGFGAADLRFTNRTAERVDDLIGRSRAMVLASHSDAMLKSICNKAILMKAGQIVSAGPVDQIFDEYHFMIHGPKLLPVETPDAADEAPAAVFSDVSIGDVGLENRLARTRGDARIMRFVAKGADDIVRWSFHPGEDVVFSVDYQALVELPSLAVILRLLVEDENGGGHIVTDFISVASEEAVPAQTSGQANFTFRNLPLRAGKFKLYASLVDRDNRIGFDVVDDNVSVPYFVVEQTEIKSRSHLAGVVSLDCVFDHSVESGSSRRAFA